MSRTRPKSSSVAGLSVVGFCSQQLHLASLSFDFPNRVNAFVDVSHNCHDTEMEELFALVDSSQFSSLTVAHFIIVKFPMTAHAQVRCHAVVTFNSAPFAVLVLPHSAVMRSHNCTIFNSTAHTAPAFCRLSYLLTTDYHLRFFKD